MGRIAKLIEHAGRKDDAMSLSESFTREMDEAPTFKGLFQILDRIDPAMFTQEEYTQLWGSYCRNRDRWPEEAFPATDWGALNEAVEPTTPELSRTGLSSDPERTVEQVTHSLGWNGSEMVMLPVCRDCRHFFPDGISPREGVGHCGSFQAIGNQDRFLLRYPMNQPKTETCFDSKGASYETDV